MICNFCEKILTSRLPKVSKREDYYFVLRSDLFFLSFIQVGWILGVLLWTQPFVTSNRLDY